MTDDEIKAARALCEAATPGPWHCYHHEGYGWRVDAEKIGIVHGDWSEADGDLVAAARTLVPLLLDEIKRLRELIDDAFAAGFEAAPESEYYVDIDRSLAECAGEPKRHGLQAPVCQKGERGLAPDLSA